MEEFFKYNEYLSNFGPLIHDLGSSGLVYSESPGPVAGSISPETFENIISSIKLELLDCNDAFEAAMVGMKALAAYLGYEE